LQKTEAYCITFDQQLSKASKCIKYNPQQKNTCRLFKMYFFLFKGSINFSVKKNK